jgi:glucose/arabinose dehydrogenase
MNATRSRRRIQAGLIASLVGLVPGVRAETQLTTVRVAAGLTLPLFVTAPPGDTTRLFIVEQHTGTDANIKILNLSSGIVNATPFLTIHGVSTGNEQGLLGMAFHPAYATNGYFYVNFTNSAGTTVIQRYTVSANPDVADPNSAYAIVSITQPYSNHNGGWIAFGPDGYLYVGMGDGGSEGDPQDRAQNLNELLGKILRIDVNSDAFPGDPNTNYAIPPSNPFVGRPGNDAIWAYGLRNPWRNSFDRLTGDLYIADVGQGAWEEVDFQSAASLGGENCGWDCYEGNAPYDPNDCTPFTLKVFPIYTYDHGGSRCAITGGYVYRGSRICDLQGTYFFADYCAAQIWSFRYDGTNLTDFRDRTAQLDPPGSLAINSITSFGEDAAGELYICDQGGEIFKIVPVGPARGDLNNDGNINFADINPFVLALSDPDAYEAQYGYPPVQAGDINCDGHCDFGDINPFVALLSGTL